jgi:alcohol dehydrogenase class IV
MQDSGTTNKEGETMLPEYFEFSLPTRLVYGNGLVGNIRETIQPLGRRKAILVTDEILVKAGPVDKVLAGFDKSNISIVCTFDKVPPNSTITTVEQCAAMAVKHKCNLIIAIGGGSVIDTAKVANILIKKGGRVEDHMGAYLLKPSEKLLPSIYIPTTAGTGSEVTKVAVIADPVNDVKLPFAEDQFLPQLAILDPEMTVSMPPKLTAATGMDALTHAIEAYVDKEHSPASDALALHAMKLLSANILQACAHPDDLEARGGMLVGSFLAGVAFSHSMVGMAHGIAHALGGVYHIPHGLANALVLPEVMAHNLEAEMERYADIALALGISFPQLVEQGRSLLTSGRFDLLSHLAAKSQIEPLSDLVSTGSHKVRTAAARAIGNFGFVDNWVKQQAAQAAVDRIRTLNRQLAHLTGMPLNLKDAGIRDNLAIIERVATTAMEDGSMLYNPVEPDRETVIAIVRKAFYSKDRPLPVAPEELRPGGTKAGDEQRDQVFTSSAMLYDVLLDFYEKLREDPAIGPALGKSGLCVQFVYKRPAATITIDATGSEIRIVKGDFNGSPEVIMTMDADFAHRFWHGKANLVSALTRRQVVARGNVPKTLRLLPILKPAYELYPAYLKEKGLEDLVL